MHRSPIGVRLENAMTEMTYGPIVRVSVDLSKRVYQVHAVDQWGRLVLARLQANSRRNQCPEYPALPSLFCA